MGQGEEKSSGKNENHREGKWENHRLNDSPAARELFGQLPLKIAVKDYGGLEKIFYPPEKLSTTGTPLVKSARPGTLAYYAPWGNVVLFYKDFGAAAGLYELGEAKEGEEHIQSLTGTLEIGRVE